MADSYPRLFITGATSHAGCHLVERLLAEGASPRCLVRSEAKRVWLPAGDYETVSGDLQDTERLAGQLRGVEAVLHLAHIGNARAIVQACRQAGVRRLVVISSTRKFTRFPDESSRRVEAGEAEIERSGLDWTLLRPSMIFGDARDGNIAGLVQAVRRRRIFPLVGGGGALMQPLFVLDLADAILQAVKRPETIGRAYTLAGAAPISLRAMLETIREQCGSSIRFISLPRGPALLAARAIDRLRGRGEDGLAPRIRRLGEDKIFDISAARAELDFSPRPFAEAIRQKLAWLAQGR